MTYTCVSKLTIIDSDNGLSPGRLLRHYLNQCWNIVNWTLESKLQWNCYRNPYTLIKLEQLERLRSEDTPRHLMITHIIESYWIPSQKNNRSRTENVTEQTRFSKSRSNDLEDVGQGQRSPHATHLLMLMIICTKYGKNPSRTVDATERTRFSRPRPNDLEDVSQGQRSLYATHPLILVIICAKYGKNPWRTVDFFSRSRPKNFENLPKIKIFRFWKNRNTRHTL